MAGAVLPRADVNVGERVLFTSGANAETDPLVISKLNANDEITGFFMGTLIDEDPATLTIDIPGITISLRAFFSGVAPGDGIWFIEAVNGPVEFARCVFVPDGTSGNNTIRDGSFNVATVFQNGNLLDISLDRNNIFGSDLSLVGVPVLYPKVDTATDTSPDWNLLNFQAAAPQFSFELGIRNKNGQWSDNNWDGANDLAGFEVR